MGLVARKVNENYNKYESYLRIVRSETTISAKNNYENNHNNNYDDYINMKKNKIKSYLDDLRSRTAKNELDGAKTMQTTKDRYTIQEAAKLMGVSIRTLELREKEGMIVIIREKNKRRFITSESIQAALNNEVYEISNSENYENEINEINEPVDNSSDKEILTVEPEKYSPQTQQPIQIIDVGRNYMTEVEEKISLALSEQKKHFESMLTQQQELTVSMFEELKREKDRQIAESKASLDGLREDVERREGDIITRAITAWREEKEKERLGKRSWWRRLFKYSK